MSNLSLIYFHIKRLQYVHMFDLVDTPFHYERGDRLLITSGNFQDKSKHSKCDLKCRYCIFTLWGRDMDRTDM